MNTDRKRIQYEHGMYAAYCEDVFINVYSDYPDADIGLNEYIRKLDERRAALAAERAALDFCPCGKPAERDHVCMACHRRVWSKAFSNPRPSALRTKAIAALAILLLGFVLLACTEASNGACEAPTPCHSVQGANP